MASLKKTFINRIKDQHGWVIALMLVCFLFLLTYGFLVIEAEKNLADRARLNIDVTSALNAAANVGSGTNSNPQVDSGPGVMFQVACNHLGYRLNGTQMNNCNPADFVATANSNGVMTQAFSTVDSIDTSIRCKVKFDYNPGVITQTTIRGQSLCLDVSECQRTLLPISLLSTIPYKMGGSGCIGMKPPVAFVIASISPSLGRIYNNNNQLPPPPFLHTSAGNGGFSFDAELQRTSLPLMWDSHLTPFYSGHFSSEPRIPYFTPFATKEVKTSVVPVQNQDTVVGGAVGTAFIQSMPNVPRQTYSPLAVDTGLSLDPIQYMNWAVGTIDGSNGPLWGDAGWVALSNSANLKSRAAAATQTHLANLCFSPFRMWFHRTVQQFLYMLDSYGYPFALSAYSNGEIPLMPYVPYQHRYSPTWTSAAVPPTWGDSPRSTLVLPVMGPNALQTATLGSPAYISDQFGNTNNGIINNTLTAGAFGNVLNDTTALSMLYQGMSLCAREMLHEVQTNTLYTGVTSNAAPHLFTALPNAYNVNMPVALPTSPCTPEVQPTIEQTIEINGTGGTANRGFVFRSGGSVPPGECGPGIDYVGGSNYRNICTDLINFPTEMVNATPVWAPPPTGEVANIDPVNITSPYRACLTNQAEIPLPNAAVALSTLRIGGIMKSGWPAPKPSANTVNTTVAPQTRYFTGIDSPNVYPSFEAVPSISEFPTGSLYKAFNTFTNQPQYIPDPTALRKMVTIFMDQPPKITIPDCINGVQQCMFFPLNPVASGAFPDFTVSGLAVPFPATNPVREFIEMVQRMVEADINVAIVFIDHYSASPNISRDFIIDALRDPIGKQLTSTGSLQYALCRRTALGAYGCGTPLPGEPVYYPSFAGEATACNCVNNPPRRGVYIVSVTQKSEETYSNFQNRLFPKITIALNRAINQFVSIK